MKQKQRVLAFGPSDDLDELTKEIEAKIGQQTISALSHESHEASGDSHIETYYTAIVVFTENID
jgi:hypothetical protein